MSMCHGGFKRLLQAWLDDMDVTALEGFDRFFVYIKAADFKTGFREGDRGRQADIAQSHDSNFHNNLPSFSKIFLHYTTFFLNFNQRFEFSHRNRYNGWYHKFTLF